jgi:hypothetical protein
MRGYWWSAPFPSWWAVQAVTEFNAPAAGLVPGQVTRTLPPSDNVPTGEHDRCALLCAKEGTRTQIECEVAMDWWGWVILAVVAALILITLAVLVQRRRRRGGVIGLGDSGRSDRR